MVVFRSTLKADADGEKLHVLDEMSLREAVAGGGLLKYWFGNVDGERRGLATCEFLPSFFLSSMLCLWVRVGVLIRHE